MTVVVGLVTALIVPVLATRARDQRLLVTVPAALTAAGFAGDPGGADVRAVSWVALLGLGENASFPLALMLIVLRGGNVQATEGLSTLSQSLGYVLAAMFPLAVGAIHGASGSWTPGLILLLVLVLPQLLFGLGAGADRQLARPPAPAPATGAVTDSFSVTQSSNLL